MGSENKLPPLLLDRRTAMASRPAAAAPQLAEDGVKLLFLDLDGVICCNYHGELEADKLANVARIVEATGCQVVLSTDWRRQPHLRARAEQTLREYGCTCIGATPQFPMYARVRPKEILAWMAEYEGPIAAWCAIDDRDLVLEDGGAPAFINHFVLTEFSIGLTAALADRAIQRIGRGDSSSSPCTPVHAATSPSERWKPQQWPPAATPTAAAPAIGPAQATPASAAPHGPGGDGGGTAPAPADEPPLRQLRTLLHECSLSHLERAVRAESVRVWHGRFVSEGRIGFLSYLRGLGIGRIGERQTLANALGRAARQGRLEWLQNTPEEEDEGPADDEAPLATGAPDAAHAPHLRGSFYAAAHAEGGGGAEGGAEGGRTPGSAADGSGASAEPMAASVHGVHDDEEALPATPTPTSVLHAAMEVGTLEALREALDDCSDLASPSLVAEARHMREELKQANARRAAPPPERPVRIGVPSGGGHSPSHSLGGLCSTPSHAPCAAVLCHPHPGRGGDMYNAFIASIFVALRDRGLATLRFNFSTGHDDADPEDLDALLTANKAEAAAAVSYLREQLSADVPMLLVGFSWGAIVSLALARDEPAAIQALALVAPPIDVLPAAMHPSRGDFARWPVLLTAGDADEYCDVRRLREIAGAAATTCLVLDGVTHFLHGETARAAAQQVDAWVGSLTF